MIVHADFCLTNQILLPTPLSDIGLIATPACLVLCAQQQRHALAW